MKKPWSTQEMMILVDGWYDKPYAEILKALPGRTLPAIRQKAKALKLRRPFKWVGKKVETKGALMRQLREARERRNFTAIRVSQMIGCEKGYVSGAETGKMNPNLHTIERWCAALGVRLRVENRLGRGA